MSEDRRLTWKEQEKKDATERLLEEDAFLKKNIPE